MLFRHEKITKANDDAIAFEKIDLENQVYFYRFTLLNNSYYSDAVPCLV